MCAFCVVPFTRGRERSRNPEAIVKEAKELFDQGDREVTLLGQNVDSYRWNMSSKGVIKDASAPTVNFAGLKDMVAHVSPLPRIRFPTSHPQDMTDAVLKVMAKPPNICKNEAFCPKTGVKTMKYNLKCSILISIKGFGV